MSTYALINPYLVLLFFQFLSKNFEMLAKEERRKMINFTIKM